MKFYNSREKIHKIVLNILRKDIKTKLCPLIYISKLFFQKKIEIANDRIVS